MLNLNGITIAPNPNGTKTAVLTRKCPFCGIEHSITVSQREFLDGQNMIRGGALIQDAFPTWTPSEREFLMTGICDKCWDNM